MRIVLDTNTLLVSIGRKSKYRPIFDAFLEGKIQVLISNEIIEEYAEKLEEKANIIVSENIVRLLLTSYFVEKTDIYFKWSLINQDKDDNKFVDCALNGRADYLVTDDKHFNILKSIGFPPVKIIRTKDFLEMIESL